MLTKVSYSQRAELGIVRNFWQFVQSEEDKVEQGAGATVSCKIA